MGATVIRGGRVKDIFVGRQNELDRLGSLLGDGAARVMFVHGLAGSGKSTLMQQFAQRATAVARVLTGRSRTETGRWLSFRAVYKSVPAGSLGRLPGGLLLAAC